MKGSDFSLSKILWDLFESSKWRVFVYRFFMNRTPNRFWNNEPLTTLGGIFGSKDFRDYSEHVRYFSCPRLCLRDKSWRKRTKNKILGDIKTAFLSDGATMQIRRSSGALWILKLAKLKALDVFVWRFRIVRFFSCYLRFYKRLEVTVQTIPCWAARVCLMTVYITESAVWVPHTLYTLCTYVEYFLMFLKLFCLLKENLDNFFN